MMKYPSWRFARDGASRIITGPDQEAEGWQDTPVFAEVLEPMLEPDPESSEPELVPVGAAQPELKRRGRPKKRETTA